MLGVRRPLSCAFALLVVALLACPYSVAGDQDTLPTALTRKIERLARDLARRGMSKEVEAVLTAWRSTGAEAETIDSQRCSASRPSATSRRVAGTMAMLARHPFPVLRPDAMRRASRHVSPAPSTDLRPPPRPARAAHARHHPRHGLRRPGFDGARLARARTRRGSHPSGTRSRPQRTSRAPGPARAQAGPFERAAPPRPGPPLRPAPGLRAPACSRGPRQAPVASCDYANSTTPSRVRPSLRTP